MYGLQCGFWMVKLKVELQSDTFVNIHGTDGIYSGVNHKRMSVYGKLVNFVIKKNILIECNKKINESTPTFKRALYLYNRYSSHSN